MNAPFQLNAPLLIGEHRYPVDCYRYYPDGFRALAKWGGFQVINATAGGVPSMSAPKEWDGADDTLMILLKSDEPVKPGDYPVLKCERRVNFFSGNTSNAGLIKILLNQF